MQRKKKNRHPHMRKRILAAGLIVGLGMSSFQSAAASTVSGAKDAKEKAQQELDSTNKKIDEIEGAKNSLQSEINGIDNKLVNLLVNIGILEDELAAKELQLEQVNEDLAKAQEKEASQYEAMKKRIRYMYEKGDTAFLDALVGSKDMAELLNRVEYVNDVYDYDRSLLEDYKNTVQQVADLKSTVETEKSELEDMQNEYAKQQEQLEAMLSEKKAKLGDYEGQLANAQAEAESHRQTIAKQNEIIRKEEEKAAKAAAAAAAAAANKSSGKQKQAPNQDNQGGGGASQGDSGQNPGYSTGVSGSEVVAYACKFVGNPYVWGGTSLTNGADCSGFIMSVYANFGISLPHSSAAMQSSGKAVSYANAQPGDIICYSGHVAIYMGGGQIVHAQSQAVGITTGSATYRTIVAVRRVL